MVMMVVVARDSGGETIFFHYYRLVCAEKSVRNIGEKYIYITKG